MASFDQGPPGDAKSSEMISRTKCAQWHTVEQGGGHKQGPNLNGLFGRQSGTLPGYSYSAANKNMAVGWGDHTLYDYLLNPMKVSADDLPTSKVTFKGLGLEAEFAGPGNFITGLLVGIIVTIASSLSQWCTGRTPATGRGGANEGRGGDGDPPKISSTTMIC